MMCGPPNTDLLLFLSVLTDDASQEYPTILTQVLSEQQDNYQLVCDEVNQLPHFTYIM